MSVVLEVDSAYCGETERDRAKENSLLLERAHWTTQLARDRGIVGRKSFSPTTYVYTMHFNADRRARMHAHTHTPRL